MMASRARQTESHMFLKCARIGRENMERFEIPISLPAK
jgi:hypothetical protein